MTRKSVLIALLLTPAVVAVAGRSGLSDIVMTAWAGSRQQPPLPAAVRIAANSITASSAPIEPFIDSLFAEYSKPSVPGAAVLLARGGQVLLRKAYGLADVESRTPVTSGTTFHLASLTKPFTAVAVLMLVSDGTLTLDETISDVFPEFPAYGRRITMRHLLTHTHGLFDGQLLPPARAGETGVLSRLARTDSASFSPGSQFRYGSVGYGLLAEIIEKRSGVLFGAFLKRRIFEPLGMRATFVCGDAEPAPALSAHGYSRIGSAWQRAGLRCDPSGWLGAGGVVSSVDDLVRFDQALYTEKLLPAGVLNEAFTAFTLADGAKGPFGYGWVVGEQQGRRSLAHFGSMAGFRTYLTRFPDQRVTIIVLVNRDPEQNSQLPGPLSVRIAERLLGQ